LKDTSSVGTYPIIATKAIGFGVDNYGSPVKVVD
jgi:hypothetical protein